MADPIDRQAALVLMEAYAKPDRYAEAIAAIAALPAQGVRVKPLVWEAKSEWHHIAENPFGECWIKHYNGMGGLWTLYGPGHYGPNNNFPTLDAAKAAAQADYERRILAAIAPAEAGVGPAWLSNCVVCGRIVDTREKDEGGDGHGCEYTEGWTCSSECAEKLHPDPDWMQDALAAEAGGVEAEPVIGNDSPLRRHAKAEHPTLAPVDALGKLRAGLIDHGYAPEGKLIGYVDTALAALRGEKP